MRDRLAPSAERMPILRASVARARRRLGDVNAGNEEDAARGSRAVTSERGANALGQVGEERIARVRPAKRLFESGTLGRARP